MNHTSVNKMIPLVILTSSIFCINDIVNDRINGINYAVILNYDQTFNIPTVRMDISTTRRVILSFGTPKLFIVNLDAISIQQLLDIRNELGYNAETTYILVGKELPYESITSKLLSELIFLDSQNGDVHIKKADRYKTVITKIGHCYEKTFKPEKIFLNEFRYKEVAVPVCYFFDAPFGFCSNCKRKGITLDIVLMALNLLNLKANFTGYSFPAKGLKSFMNYAFTNICVILTGFEPIIGLDFTQPYTIDTVHWVVPTSKEIPRWKYAFQIFSPEVWIVWAISAISLSLIWYVIDYTMKSGIRLNQSTVGLRMIFKLFLQQSETFNVTTRSQGFLIATIIVSTSFLKLFYESKFAFLLSGLNYAKSIDSFEDIMNQGLYVRLSHDDLKDYIGEPRIFKYLNSNYKEYETSFEKIAAERDSAMNCIHRGFMYKLKNVLDEHNRPLLKELNPPIRVFLLCAILRKGDPLTNLLNEKLKYMVDFGFVDHILSNYKVENIKRDVTLKRQKLNIHSIPLAFIVWIIGVLMGVVSFFARN
ncbi:hypothetical protein WA026_010650 [Henosepilachna vigintioctopunctata]|uniref:Ionotropic receptor n=1 Tax=Henosepilachna vigintioctopunctata TaxID=420089 RepID=A0AAW1UPN1_9CUCU